MDIQNECNNDSVFISSMAIYGLQDCTSAKAILILRKLWAYRGSLKTHEKLSTNIGRKILDNGDQGTSLLCYYLCSLCTTFLCLKFSLPSLSKSRIHKYRDGHFKFPVQAGKVQHALLVVGTNLFYVIANDLQNAPNVNNGSVSGRSEFNTIVNLRNTSSPTLTE